MQSRLVVVDHPLVQHKLALMRDRTTSTVVFRALMRETAMLLGFEATRDLPLEEREIETPVAVMRVAGLSGKKLAVVSILRAGEGLTSGLLDLMPTARVGHVGLYRDPETLRPVEYYCKLPDSLDERVVLMADPMLATGYSAAAAVDLVKTGGGRDVRMICALAAPEGIAAFHEAHPDVPIVTAAVDERLNDHGYIVPGLGDAGDRLFGTR